MQIFRWLLFIFTLSLLHACGGGDSGSALSPSKGTSTTDSNGSTTTVTSVDIGLSGQSIIPAGEGQTTLTLIAFEKGTTTIASGVNLEFSVNGSAKLSVSSGNTNSKGQMSFTITDPVNENVLLTVRGINGFTGGFTRTFYFGGTVTADVVTQGLVPADGKTAASVVVVARDAYGVPISGEYVDFSFPQDSFAAATSGTTDDKGQYIGSITNTVPQNTYVTPFAGGMAARTLPLTFGTSVVAVQPQSLDLIIKNNNVPADGKTAASVVIVARDVAGVPVTNVPINISVNSATAMLSTGSKTSSVSIVGNTGSSGSFELLITDTVEEVLTLIAKMSVAASGGTTSVVQCSLSSSDTTSSSSGSTSSCGTVGNSGIVFKNATTTTTGGTQITTVGLDDPIKNNSAKQGDDARANGTDTVTVVGRVLGTSNGKDIPVADVTVSVLISGGSANMKISNNGKTDGSGFFTITFTDTVVETFTMRAVVGGISSDKKEIKFTAVATATTDTTTPRVPVLTSVDLYASPAKQSANGKDEVSITALVLDETRAPMKDVEVVLNTDGSLNASQATISSSGKTGENGTYTFKINSKQMGTFSVTVAARTVSGGSLKTVSSSAQTIEFINPIVDSVASLQVDVANNNQKVGDKINLTAIVRDSSGRALSGVPLLIKTEAEAIADPSSGTSGTNGQLAFVVTSSKAKTYAITVEVEGAQQLSGKTTAMQSVTFMGTVTTPVDVNLTQPTVVNDNQPVSTDATKGITVRVTAKDTAGKTVKGSTISVITDGELVATPAVGASGENGVFSTVLSSTKAGTYTVVFVVDGCEKAECRRTATVTFTATSTGVTPGYLELRVENNNQLANSTDRVVLIATVYDKKGGAVIADTDVSFISTSLNAKFDKTDGKTNELGEFRTSVTDTVAESFQVTAVKKASTDANLRSTQTITFLPVPISTSQPKSLVLNVLSNNKPVNEEAELVAVARDANNSPMSGVSLVFSTFAGDTLPDVSASARFTSDMTVDKLKTDSTGSVKVNVTNSEAGTFKVRATVKGSSLSSEVALTFNKSSTTLTPVDSLELLTSSPELKSEGEAAGVIITARTKDSNNNLLTGKKVSFTANSGAIQVVGKKNDAQAGVTYEPGTDDAGTTDSTGQAYARLTTVGDSANRTITVTATSETKTTTITINVVGTKVKIIGSDAVVMGTESTLNISLTDSADKGISAQVQVNADNGSLINGSTPPVTVSTDSKGLVDIKLTAVKSGATTVTVQKVKDNKPREENTISSTWTINVSQDDFTITASQVADADGVYNLPVSAKSGGGGCLPPYIGCEPPQGAMTFKVVWKSAGQPKQGGEVKLSTTRGTVTPQTGVTDANGELTFAVTSDTAGPGVVTATTTASNGPSKSIKVYFTAQEVASMVLQAIPSTVGINVSGGTEQQSKINALLRDKDGNVVKGKRIVFRVEDITGGSVSPASAISDASGQANITYYAGGSPSASNGVTVYARVEGVNSIYCTDGQASSSECAVSLTVALKKVFITIGTGNKISNYNGTTTTYSYPYTLLITDINGAPVQGEQVILSINTLYYRKGFNTFSGSTKIWNSGITATCPSEDVNFNGLLDSGEDNNGDGILTPGNVATFAADSTSSSENSTVTIKTGKDGFASFSVIYPKNFANWAGVQLTARAGESVAYESFWLAASADDMTNDQVAPPGKFSPYGVGGPLPTGGDPDKPESYTLASCNNTL